MWPNRTEQAQKIIDKLEEHSLNRVFLPGVADEKARTTLSWQVVASIRRQDYTRLRINREISKNRLDPSHNWFDPELAAVLLSRSGNTDEAIWLIFLASHFGKHQKHGWERLKFVYCGDGTKWTWERTSKNLNEFKVWLDRVGHDVPGAFSNHRKYESLGAYNNAGTGTVVGSFIDFVGAGNTPSSKFSALTREGGNDPHSIFDHFYSEFSVKRFGRLGRFDFLSLVGRLNLAPIEPGIAYLAGATGPKKGAMLLYTGDTDGTELVDILESNLKLLGNDLGVGMQVMEDSLCNWQKSPQQFVNFLG